MSDSSRNMTLSEFAIETHRRLDAFETLWNTSREDAWPFEMPEESWYEQFTGFLESDAKTRVGETVYRVSVHQVPGGEHVRYVHFLNRKEALDFIGELGPDFVGTVREQIPLGDWIIKAGGVAQAIVDLLNHCGGHADNG